MENVSSKADINETRKLLAEAREGLKYLIKNPDFPDRKEWIKIEERQWQADGSRFGSPLSVNAVLDMER